MLTPSPVLIGAGRGGEFVHDLHRCLLPLGQVDAHAVQNDVRRHDIAGRHAVGGDHFGERRGRTQADEQAVLALAHEIADRLAGNFHGVVRCGALDRDRLGLGRHDVFNRQVFQHVRLGERRTYAGRLRLKGQPLFPRIDAVGGGRKVAEIFALRRNQRNLHDGGGLDLGIRDRRYVDIQKLGPERADGIRLYPVGQNRAGKFRYVIERAGRTAVEVQRLVAYFAAIPCLAVQRFRGINRGGRRYRQHFGYLAVGGEPCFHHSLCGFDPSAVVNDRHIVNRFVTKKRASIMKCCFEKQYIVLRRLRYYSKNILRGLRLYADIPAYNVGVRA